MKATLKVICLNNDDIASIIIDKHKQLSNHYTNVVLLYDDIKVSKSTITRLSIPFSYDKMTSVPDKLIITEAKKNIMTI